MVNRISSGKHHPHITSCNSNISNSCSRKLIILQRHRQCTSPFPSKDALSGPVSRMSAARQRSSLLPESQHPKLLLTCRHDHASTVGVPAIGGAWNVPHTPCPPLRFRHYSSEQLPHRKRQGSGPRSEAHGALGSIFRSHRALRFVEHCCDILGLVSRCGLHRDPRRRLHAHHVDGNHTPVHRTLLNCSIYLQAVWSNNSTRFPSMGGAEGDMLSEC